MLCERGLLTRKHGSEPTLHRSWNSLVAFGPTGEELRQRLYAGFAVVVARYWCISPEEILSLGFHVAACSGFAFKTSTYGRQRGDGDREFDDSYIYLPNPKFVTDSLYGHLEMNNVAPTRAFAAISVR